MHGNYPEMTPDRLLGHYERIADAPDAVARLRRFILDLAVRGKLVPQDANDEPASELLKRIAKEKARLVKTGVVRESKGIPALSETLFSIPAHWRWSQLAEIGVLSPRNEALDTLEASFVPMPLIAAEYGVANQHEIRPWGEIKKGYTHFAVGDVGLAKITPCFENGKSTVFRNLTGGLGAGTTELHIVRPLFVDQNYILLFLKCPHFIKTGVSKMTGTAGQKRVPTEYFAHSPFPLPPLAEQHRIVAKVDELMGLCDRLEAARQAREAARDRLAAASLARLNTPDPEIFQADASFVLDALPALTTRPDQIKRLRQTILNLAVRGKLMPQDAKDESAANWLLRPFNSETVGRGTKVKSFGATPSDEVKAGYNLAASWLWMELGKLVTVMDAGWSPQCENHARSDPETWGVLKTTAVQTLAFDCSQNKELPAKFAPRPQHEARVGDILVTRAGPKNRVGISCVVDQTEPRLMISDKLIRFRLIDGLNPRFFALTLNAGVTSIAIEDAKSGMAVMQMNISQDKLRAVPVPLPPLAEQHRIVAKVDALMALCDRLEASLTATAATRRRLLDALLAEALAPPQGASEGYFATIRTAVHA